MPKYTMAEIEAALLPVRREVTYRLARHLNEGGTLTDFITQFQADAEANPASFVRVLARRLVEEASNDLEPVLYPDGACGVEAS